MILTCTALSIFIGAAAQIEQGRILASGSLGISHENFKAIYDGNTEFELKTTTFSLSPRVGYFFTDAIAAGVGISLSSSTMKYDDDDKYNYTSTYFTPFVRYYLPQRLFGQFEIGLGGTKNKWTYEDGDNDESKYSSFTWSLGAGYAYFLNNYVAIESIISYTSLNYTHRDDTKEKERYGTIMLQIGLSIYLDK